MNDFIDYCFGISIACFGVSFLIISVGLITGLIK